MRIFNLKYWAIIALVNLIIAAGAGLLMRYAFIGEVSLVAFKDLMQAHSHIAMLGWLFTGLCLVIIHFFDIMNSYFNLIFTFAQIAIIGMFIAFLLSGYQAPAIVFLTIHMVLAIMIVWLIIKGLKKKGGEKLFSNLWLKTSLFFLSLSFVGPLSLGLIVRFGEKGGWLYYAAIQFFLHFQFNGWMIFALFALFYKLIENQNIKISNKLSQRFYRLMLVSCFLTYALAIAWSNPYSFIFLINSTGVVVQFAALVVLIAILRPIYQVLKLKIRPALFWLFLLAFSMFVLKIGIQTFIVLPVVAKVAYTIRLFVIGFIHLLLLGVVSFTLLAFLYQSEILDYNRYVNRLGVKTLAAGFLLSDAWMFIQGILLWTGQGFVPYFNEFLFLFSIPLLLGVVLVTGSQLQKEKISQPSLAK